MKFYIDGEWNGYRGEMLSIALVPVDVRVAPFYRTFKFYGDLADDWIAKNVWIHIDGSILENTIVIQRSLEDYLMKFDSVHIVADWPEDIERFCRLLILGPGERINTPPLTMEVVRVDAPSNIPHHALFDAMGLRDYLADRGK